MIKRAAAFLLAFIIAFSFTFSALAHAKTESPDYGVLHLQRKGTPSSSGLIEYITVDESGDLVELSDGRIAIPFNEQSPNLPASYDARADGIAGKVRNQGSFGTCWAIAVSSVMETYAYKHKLADADSLDFSETHLAYFGNNSLVTDTDDPTSGDGQVSLSPWNEGGNVFKAAAALARWSGIATSSDFPYSSINSPSYKLNEKDRYNANSSFILESYDILSLNDRNQVKAWIYENGSATLSYSHNEKFLKLNNGTYSYYANEDTQEYHAVTVVGWDDNYSALNFAVTPEGNGAWLCKNSWGKSWSNGGYYWISYYDTTIYRFSGLKAAPKNSFVTLEPEDELEHSNFNNYTYNGAMYLSMITSDEEISAANVFTAKTAERLSAVSTYTSQGNVIATVSVYKNLPENYSSPLDGVLAGEPQSFLIENEGYHTLRLSDYVTLSKSEKFAVVIDFTASGTEIALPIEYDGEDGNAENYVYDSFPRQSYVNTGSGWFDVNDEGYDNVYIQAFTDSISLLPESGQKIILGSYPQSEVTDEKLTSALESLNSTWNLYSYYSGNGLSGTMSSSNIMKYTDVEYNSEKYRGVKILNYRPYYSEETSKPETSYQDENGYYINRTYWFRYEPLVWSVINKGEGLILCDTVIDSQPYNNLVYRFDSDGDGTSSNNEYYSDTLCSVPLNDYENSSVRSWLNGDFYNTCFSEKEKKFIAQRLNGNESYSSQSVYSDTQDKVFLLSYGEISDRSVPTGFVNGISIITSATDYAKCQGIKTFIGTSSVYWWLRTAYSEAAFNCTVSYNGRIGSPNLIWSSSTAYGIRPAIKINPDYNAHTVSWNNSSEIKTASYRYGDIITLPEEPSRIGYTFAGWIPEVPACMPNKDLSFNATWNENSYDICFDALGGSWNGETSKTVSCKFGQKITEPPTPYKQGYVFAGWADSQGNHPDILNTTQKITYYALWTPSDKTPYTVRTYLMDTGGTYRPADEQALRATTGSNVSVTPESIEGFTLNKDASVLSGTVLPDGTLKLNAYYDRNRYNLTVNEGESLRTYKLYFDEEITVPIPQKTGHRFEGWNTPLPLTMPAKNIAVTAEWTVNKYTLSFDTNGAEAVAPLTQDYATPITPPNAPHKDGYVFLGWSPEIPETMPAENITVKAIFGLTDSLSLTTPSVDSVKYGETLVLHAQSENLPRNIYYRWTSDSNCVKLEPSANGKTCNVTPVSNGNAVVTVSLIDENGNEVLTTDSEVMGDSLRISSKVGFFWRIISFFKNLFGIERVIDG